MARVRLVHKVHALAEHCGSRAEGEANEDFREDEFEGLGDFTSLDMPPRQRNRKQQNPVYEALCSLLLETCDSLLSTQILQHLDELNVTAEQLQERGKDMKTLIDSAQGQHARTCEIINEMPAEAHTTQVIMGDIVCSHHRHDGELALELSNTASRVLSPQILTRARKRFAANGLDRLFPHTDGRFSFLRDKILKFASLVLLRFAAVPRAESYGAEEDGCVLDHQSLQVRDVRPQSPGPCAQGSPVHDCLYPPPGSRTSKAVRVDVKSRQEVAALFE